MSQARSRQGADQRAFARTRAAGDDDEIIPSGFQVHGSAVQLVLDRLGGSESQLLRRRDLDRLAIGGIAALPRWAVLDLELAEAGERDFCACRGSIGDRDENGIHDLLRVCFGQAVIGGDRLGEVRSEEHTSELQSLMRISYAVFCLKKKRKKRN